MTNAEMYLAASDDIERHRLFTLTNNESTRLAREILTLKYAMCEIMGDKSGSDILNLIHDYAKSGIEEDGAIMTPEKAAVTRAISALLLNSTRYLAICGDTIDAGYAVNQAECDSQADDAIYERLLQ